MHQQVWLQVVKHHSVGCFFYYWGNWPFKYYRTGWDYFAFQHLKWYWVTMISLVVAESIICVHALLWVVVEMSRFSFIWWMKCCIPVKLHLSKRTNKLQRVHGASDIATNSKIVVSMDSSEIYLSLCIKDTHIWEYVAKRTAFESHFMRENYEFGLLKAVLSFDNTVVNKNKRKVTKCSQWWIICRVSASWFSFCNEMNWI